MSEKMKGDTPPQERAGGYSENSVLESEFSELTQGAEEVGSGYGQYGNWRSFKHPEKEGWYLVEYTSKDAFQGSTRFFETDDPRWEGHKE